MMKYLRKIYIVNLILLVACFIALGTGRSLALFTGLRVPIFFTITIFIFSAVGCLALPVLIRTLFANSVKDKKFVTKKEFSNFEKRLLYVSMMTPWFSFLGYLCIFPKFYLASINLMALYALYYYYPSEKRINFDKKIFRVKIQT